MLKSEAATLAANKRLNGANNAIAAEKERIARLQEVVQREKERKEAAEKMASMEMEKENLQKKQEEESEKFFLEKKRLEDEQEKGKERAEKLKRRKKKDEKALQNLIAMQAKGLQAATTAKSKMTKLAQEQKEIATRAEEQRRMYGRLYFDFIILLLLLYCIFIVYKIYFSTRLIKINCLFIRGSNVCH